MRRLRKEKARRRPMKKLKWQFRLSYLIKISFRIIIIDFEQSSIVLNNAFSCAGSAKSNEKGMPYNRITQQRETDVENKNHYSSPYSITHTNENQQWLFLYEVYSKRKTTMSIKNLQRSDWSIPETDFFRQSSALKRIDQNRTPFDRASLNELQSNHQGIRSRKR